MHFVFCFTFLLRRNWLVGWAWCWVEYPNGWRSVIISTIRLLTVRLTAAGLNRLCELQLVISAVRIIWRPSTPVICADKFHTEIYKLCDLILFWLFAHERSLILFGGRKTEFLSFQINCLLWILIHFLISNYQKRTVKVFSALFSIVHC